MCNKSTLRAFFITLITFFVMGACQHTDPSVDPCSFELPPLSGYNQETLNNGRVILKFNNAWPPEEWLLATDEHPDAHVLVYEDGGLAIELPADHEIEQLENGNIRLHLPGCSQTKE